ncbi:hypothetical protein DPMN_143692 [Dreissena polymorpha]|uniref:Uncharacterized protein n=1 Tax=Dreissena polymorpha TaxID=45954 RepID=A0A9D4GDK7_DREPO|nr:hypothetical protein DPMN_143692 [Dreissena polymorpha]
MNSESQSGRRRTRTLCLQEDKNTKWSSRWDYILEPMLHTIIQWLRLNPLWIAQYTTLQIQMPRICDGT